jgi:hypothetical protein
MESLSARSIGSPENFSTTVNFHMFNQPEQKRENEGRILSNSVSIPTTEKIEYLNKIGHEYPFCVFHKYKINDTL